MATVAPPSGGPAPEFWWVWYNVQSGQPAQVIQALSAADVQNKTGFPPLGGPFATQADAEAWLQSSGVAQKTTPKTPPNPLSGLAAIGDFFGRLTEASTWIRIAEVALGAILVAVGVARITHAVPIATKIAETAGAVAV